ncbi:MAG: TonB-dependent receptor [Myxococcaceae bacterium]|nr:TonB-dependent receptor [Myxococcaceae bacterium]
MRHHAASALAIIFTLGATAAMAQDGGTATATVDSTTPTQGVTLTQDFLDRVPLVRPNATGQRNFEDLARAAPQVTPDRYGYGFNGALSPENLYLSDGVAVNDPTFGSLQTSRGVGGAQVPLEFLETVTVLTSGLDPGYGRASGGVLNVVTKSGSNELRGSVWGTWWPGALTANPLPVANTASALSTTTKRHNTGDFGVELGGALVKDRLFFYAGLAQSVDRQRVTRTVRRFLLADDGRDFLYDGDGAIRSEAIASSSRFDDRRAFTWLGKLTWRITEGHTLAVTATGTPQERHAPVLEPSGADSRFTTETLLTSLSYTGAFLDRRLLVDATAGWSRTAQATLPSDGSRPGDTSGAAGIPRTTYGRSTPFSLRDFEELPTGVASLCEPAGFTSTRLVSYKGTLRHVMACPVTGGGATYSLGGPGLLSESSADRLQARANASYRFELLGTHVARAGVDLEWTRVDETRAYSGAVQLADTPGGALLGVRDEAFVAGPNARVPLLNVRTTPTQLSTGAFLQDTWRLLDVVTVNAGLRYDSQQLFASNGQLGLALNSMLSPRVGLSYDFTREGRSRVFANYAVYQQHLPLHLADRALSGAASTRTLYTGCPTVPHPTSDCTAPSNAAPINADPLSPSPDSVRLAAGRVAVDPALKPMARGELTAGLEYEVLANLRIGLVGTHHWLLNAVETMSNDDGATWFLGNPGEGLAKGFTKAERKYFAATLYGSRSFSSGWLVQGSYTLSSLVGNYAGLFRPETGELEPGVSRDFDTRASLANRWGPLPSDRTHQFKAYVAKDFELSSALSVRAGLGWETLSGTPLSYLAADRLLGADEAFVFARGSAGRTPWLHTVNLRGALVWQVTKEQAVQVSLDVFNLFNLQEATEVSQRLSSANVLPANVAAGSDPATAACLAGNTPTCQTVLRKLTSGGVAPVQQADLNGGFKQPLAFQQPLSVRLGVKLSF